MFHQLQKISVMSELLRIERALTDELLSTLTAREEKIEASIHAKEQCAVRACELR